VDNSLFTGPWRQGFLWQGNDKIIRIMIPYWGPASNNLSKFARRTFEMLIESYEFGPEFGKLRKGFCSENGVVQCCKIFVARKG
jgi:hypothetical protein